MRFLDVSDCEKKECESELQDEVRRSPLSRIVWYFFLSKAYFILDNKISPATSTTIGWNR